MDAIQRDNLSEAKMLEQFRCLVGVADCPFTINKGEISCLMGLSGSGKSAMAPHLKRLVERAPGQISLPAEDTRSLGERELLELRANHMGMVFQHMALLPHRTARDNVAFPPRIRREPKSHRREVSRRCLNLVNLDGYEDRFPRDLSGGIHHRVGLARVLAEVPLKNKPFSALDPLIRRQLQYPFMALSAEMQAIAVLLDTISTKPFALATELRS